MEKKIGQKNVKDSSCGKSTIVPIQPQSLFSNKRRVYLYTIELKHRNLSIHSSLKLASLFYFYYLTYSTEQSIKGTEMRLTKQM